MPDDVDRVVAMALANPVNRTILERAPELGVPDWWLTGGAVFQSVWNALDGRDPRAGITDHDLFYFDDSDLSWESEDEVVQRAAALFADVDAVVEVRNEARVHLWYAEHFGAHGVAFTCTRDAIDHFAATACCLGLTCAVDGTVDLHAPFGVADVLAQRLRPNPVLAPREVYEAKAARWLQEWPGLTVDPWPSVGAPG